MIGSSFGYFQGILKQLWENIPEAAVKSQSYKSLSRSQATAIYGIYSLRIALLINKLLSISGQVPKKISAALVKFKGANRGDRLKADSNIVSVYGQQQFW